MREIPKRQGRISLIAQFKIMTGLFTAALSFAVVLFRHSVTSHMAGLCLTSAIMIMSDVFLFTRYAAALEKSMVSVERLQASCTHNAMTHIGGRDRECMGENEKIWDIRYVCLCVG